MASRRPPRFRPSPALHLSGKRQAAAEKKGSQPLFESKVITKNTPGRFGGIKGVKLLVLVGDDRS
jgi:hypothetical protein